jgi:hypothetical protein
MEQKCGSTPPESLDVSAAVERRATEITQGLTWRRQRRLATCEKESLPRSAREDREAEGRLQQRPAPTFALLECHYACSTRVFVIVGV